jgi:hydrogenase/urease accessory protein HupE
VLLFLPIAHGTLEGIGDLWNGVLHPLRSPAQLMVLCGLALLAGQRVRIRMLLTVFLVTSALGAAFTVLGWPEPPTFLPCIIAGVTGVFAAARLPLRRNVQLALFAAAGFVLGWDSGQDPAPAWVTFKLLFGVWIGLAVIMLNLANYAVICPRKQWVKVGFRVLASWVVASSILFLAFSLRPISTREQVPTNASPARVETAPEVGR